MTVMKLVKQSRVIAGLVALFGCVGPVCAVDIISVDMDLATPGIQSTRIAAPGATFQIGLVMTVDAAGVSSYSISSLFDTAELSLTASPRAATNVTFDGLGELAFPSENNALGQVYSFNGATFGTGPSLTNFTFGTINFTAVTPVTDALTDISLGFFNGGVDGFFDNAGNPVVPIFDSALLNAVPEPSTVSLLLCGMAATWLVRRRWTLRGRNVGSL